MSVCISARSRVSHYPLTWDHLSTRRARYVSKKIRRSRFPQPSSPGSSKFPRPRRLTFAAIQIKCSPLSPFLRVTPTPSCSSRRIPLASKVRRNTEASLFVFASVGCSATRAEKSTEGSLTACVTRSHVLARRVTALGAVKLQVDRRAVRYTACLVITCRLCG